MSNSAGTSADNTILRYHEKFSQFVGVENNSIRSGTAIDPEQPPNKARQKLLKLSQTHFTELATDVYDELQRRVSDYPDVPKYLLPKPEIHPKRNQARQKLAMLSSTRFNDLATDILYELERRFPELRWSSANLEGRENEQQEQSVEEDRREQERQEQERQEQERQEQERQEQERQEQERQEQERQEQERQEQERQEQERQEQERQEQERQEQERQLERQLERQELERALERQHLERQELARQKLEQEYEPESRVLASEELGDRNENIYLQPSLSTSHSLSHVSLPDTDTNGSLNGRSSLVSASSQYNSMDGADFTPLTVPQSLKSTTIIPKKSTLVEEGDDDDDDDDKIAEEEEEEEEIIDQEETTTDSEILALEQPTKPFETPFEAPSPGLRGESSEEEMEPQEKRMSSFDPGMITLDSIAEEEEMMSEVEKNQSKNYDDRELAPKSEDSHAQSTYSNDPSDLAAELKDRDEQIQMLVEEGSRMDETINKLERQLSESEEFKSSLSQEIDILHTRLAEVEPKNVELVQELEELRSQHQSNCDEMEKHKAKAADLEETLASLQLEHQSVQDAHNTSLSQQAELQEVSDGLNHQLNSLNDTINKHEEQLEEHTTNPVNSDAQEKYDILLEDHSKLQNELENQQQLTEKVRQEASDFLLEMRNLAENQQKNWEASENMSNQIQKLKVEVQEWKSKYSRAKSQVRDLRSLSVYGGSALVSQPINLENSPFIDLMGRVKDSSVAKFQFAMDEFLQKSRDSKANILEFLHNLVIATRVITQDVSDHEGINEANQAQIAQCTALVSSTANQLITTTRNHATSGGFSPISVLDAAASDLSFAVVELLKLAKVMPAANENNFPKEVTPEMSTRSSNERYSLRSSTTDNSVPPEGRIKRDNNNIQVKKREASIHMSDQYAKGFKDIDMKFDMDDPDNTVAELQAYLEEKTAGAVDGIQNLLSGIKDNSPYGELKLQILDITNHVDSMVEATGISMQQSRNRLLKDKGTYILDNLSDCSARLTNVYMEIKNQDDLDTPDRSLKQRLASLSFDMAKCTKELVKTVEEVSLHQEISHIDSQLAV